MPDSVMPNYIMPDSCFDEISLCLIPLCLTTLCLIPVFMKPRYAWFRYTRFRYTGFYFCMLCPIPLCQVPPNLPANWASIMEALCAICMNANISFWILNRICQDRRTKNNTFFPSATALIHSKRWKTKSNFQKKSDGIRLRRRTFTSSISLK